MLCFAGSFNAEKKRVTIILIIRPSLLLVVFSGWEVYQSKQNEWEYGSRELIAIIVLTTGAFPETHHTRESFSASEMEP